jgi:multidrug efflux pump subunit AcrA (membrane-fusion protein)
MRQDPELKEADAKAQAVRQAAELDAQAALARTGVSQEQLTQDQREAALDALQTWIESMSSVANVSEEARLYRKLKQDERDIKNNEKITEILGFFESGQIGDIAGTSGDSEQSTLTFADYFSR